MLIVEWSVQERLVNIVNNSCTVCDGTGSCEVCGIETICVN